MGSPITARNGPGVESPDYGREEYVNSLHAQIAAVAAARVILLVPDGPMARPEAEAVSHRVVHAYLSYFPPSTTVAAVRAAIDATEGR